MPKPTLDAIDRQILRHLQENARIPNVDLARRVGLSPSPCSRRVRELETEGVIRRYATLIDPGAAGLPVSVFISVTLDKQIERNLEVFESAVTKLPEVMECHVMTGDSDYMLRIAAPDIDSFRSFIMNEVLTMPGVDRTRTNISLGEVKYTTALPLSINAR